MLDSWSSKELWKKSENFRYLRTTTNFKNWSGKKLQIANKATKLNKFEILFKITIQQHLQILITLTTLITDIIKFPSQKHFVVQVGNLIGHVNFFALQV